MPIAYRANIDMLALMDSGDAPVYVRSYDYDEDDLEATALLFTLLHHAVHGLAIKARAVEVGLESVAYSEDPQYPLTDPSGELHVPFLTRHLLL